MKASILTMLMDQNKTVFYIILKRLTSGIREKEINTFI